MKKPKIEVVTLSPKKEDGGRDTVREKILCTCQDYNTADTILHALRATHAYEYNYPDKRENIKPDEIMRFTTIKY